MNQTELEALPWTRLPFVFDPAGLHADLAGIDDSEWVAHFNAQDFEGTWSSLSLRSRTGRADDIFASGDVAEFADTALLARCPHLRAVIDTFELPLKAVRLLRLHAGSRVLEHMDRDLGLRDGELRIHVPLQTNEQVEFVVNNRRLPLREGESWYIDFSQPHRIFNGGNADRIHLVLDGKLNAWAAALLARSADELVTETSEPEGTLAFREFRELVFEDPQLQAGLMSLRPRGVLLDAVVAVGQARGFAFGRAEAEAAMGRGKREWNERGASL